MKKKITYQGEELQFGSIKAIAIKSMKEMMVRTYHWEDILSDCLSEVPVILLKAEKKPPPDGKKNIYGYIKSAFCNIIRRHLAICARNVQCNQFTLKPAIGRMQAERAWANPYYPHLRKTEQRLDAQKILKMDNGLTETEKIIIKEMYGFNRHKMALTSEEVGEIVGLRPSSVRQARDRAIGKIRKKFELEARRKEKWNDRSKTPPPGEYRGKQKLDAKGEL